jgi:hypothetical protein
MAVPWSTPEDGAHVEATLGAHPVASGRCREAALGVLPIARKVDAIATMMRFIGEARAVEVAEDVDRH